MKNPGSLGRESIHNIVALDLNVFPHNNEVSTHRVEGHRGCVVGDKQGRLGAWADQ